MIYLF